jgi:hypothetical protein
MVYPAHRDPQSLLHATKYGLMSGQQAHYLCPRRQSSQPRRWFGQSWVGKSMVCACAKGPRFQKGQGKPIMLFLCSAMRVSAAVARRRVRITRSHPASHPVYCALTLSHPGRATLKRRSPTSHPGGTHPTILRT